MRSRISLLRAVLTGAMAAPVLVALVAVSSAGANVDPRVTALRAAGCPDRYAVVDRTDDWSGAEQQLALDSRFEISRFPPGAITLAPPIDWAQDPFASESWRGDLHALKWLDVLLYIYRRGEAREERLRALTLARDIVLDWIASNPLGAIYRDGKPWGDKVSADRAPYLAYIARAATCEEERRPGDDGILSDAQAGALLDSAETHGRFLSDPANHRPNNHGLFVDFGLLLLGSTLAGILPEAPVWAELGRDRFPTTLHGRLFSEEALWLEHSAGYQRLATNLFADYLDFSGVGTPGEPRYDPRLVDLLSRMQDATGWFVMPDRTLPQLGDTHRREAPRFALERAGDDAGMRVFPRSGYVVVKEPTRGSYLAVSASFHNGTHKHADELNFELFERDRRVVTDTGLYHKDRDQYWEFGQAAEAHSVLTVDGGGFPVGSEDAYGSGIEATGRDAGWYAIQARNPLLLARGVRHTRLFLFRPRVALIVVDLVRSKQEHTYRRYFHMGPDLRARPSGSGVPLKGPGFSGVLLDSDRAGRRTLTTGQLDPLLGQTFPSWRVAVPRTTVTLSSRRSADADFAMAVSLGEERYRATVTGGPGTSVLVEPEGDRPYLLHVEREGAQLDPSKRSAKSASRRRQGSRRRAFG